MRQVGRMWWLLVVVLALVPVGLKARSIWNRPRPQPLDPEMAQVGEMLFKHEWQVKDSLSASGDGLGPVFNATSCVACHNQGGVGGAGGLKHNVNVFTVREADTGKIREGVVHAMPSRRCIKKPWR